MRNLLDNLEEAEMNLDQVVATNVYLDDLSDTPAFDEVYAQYFGPVLRRAPRSNKFHLRNVNPTKTTTILTSSRYP